MAKTIKKIPWSNIALVVGLGFAWSKLGLGAAVKEIAPAITFRGEPPPRVETGFLTMDEWEARFGKGSALDYQDWLKGQ